MNDFFYKNIGLRIAQKRINRKLSQEKLAELAGLSRNYIGKIERGERKATLDVLRQITTVLNYSFEELFRGL
mgnify:CR=1 FL=1